MLKLHPDVEELWPLHRVILEDYAKLDGIDNCSIDDIDLMCLASDAWHAAQPKG